MLCSSFRTEAVSASFVLNWNSDYTLKFFYKKLKSVFGSLIVIYLNFIVDSYWLSVLHFLEMNLKYSVSLEIDHLKKSLNIDPST